MTPIRAAFICSKACDIIAEDAFSVSSQHSIGLVDIKRGTFMHHRADMSLDMMEKYQLVPERIHRLFKDNFLKAVSRTQIEGSCKVHAGKTNWTASWMLPFQARSGKHLKHSLQMAPIRAAFICSKACDIVAEDAFSVSSQHSIGLIDIKWGTFMWPQSRYVTWYVESVGRTQIEGSCTVYAGKTYWKTYWKLYLWSLASKKWGALETPWQMTPIRAPLICSKACDIIAEDASSVASQHSSVLFLRSAGTAW